MYGTSAVKGVIASLVLLIGLLGLCAQIKKHMGDGPGTFIERAKQALPKKP